MTTKTVRLGDVANLLSGFAFKSQQFIDEAGNGVKLVRGDNVQQGYIRWGDKTKKWANEDCGSLARYQLIEDDVILAMDRPIVGGGLKLAWIKKEDMPCLLVQRVTRIRGLPNIALTKYLRYSLAGPQFIAHIEKITTGANIPHISGKDIANYEFSLPPITTQQKIVDVIIAYDDLIETNRNRIALLEEAARLLYREWFVDLHFPGHEVADIADGVPIGWQYSTLSEICVQVRDQVDPANIAPDTAYLSMEHMTPKSFCLDKWETAGKVVSAKLCFQINDVLFGRIRPYFHKVGFAQIAGITSTDMIVVRATSKNLYPLLLMVMSSDDFVAHATGTSNGSKMPRADWKVLQHWKILLPPSNLLDAYAEIAQGIFDTISTLSKSNTLLQAARDELLPKLMSGQLSI